MNGEEQDVRRVLWLAIATVFVLQCASAQADAGENCEAFTQKDEGTLLRLEQTWAKALELRDAKTVGCLLAPEFEDAAASGTLYTRPDVLAHIPDRKPTLNHLQEMHVHIFGEAAYVRGLNLVTDGSGKELARVRFTDIFAYSNGKWQAVAGQETMVADTH